MRKKVSASQPATKKDIDRVEKSLRKFATKVDFKNLRSGLLKVESRVENLEEGQVRIETKLDRIENKMDGFVGVVDNLKKDNEVGADQYREHDVKIKDHEARITTLESI